MQERRNGGYGSPRFAANRAQLQLSPHEQAQRRDVRREAQGHNRGSCAVNQVVKWLPWQLQTERLILAGPDPAEAETVYAGIQESMAELQQWMPWARDGQTLEQVRTYLTEARPRFEAGTQFHWNLWLRERGDERSATSFVGACGTPSLDWSVPRFEIGYWVRTSLVHRGRPRARRCGLRSMQRAPRGNPRQHAQPAQHPRRRTPRLRARGDPAPPPARK